MLYESSNCILDNSISPLLQISIRIVKYSSLKSSYSISSAYSKKCLAKSMKTCYPLNNCSGLP